MSVFLHSIYVNNSLVWSGDGVGTGHASMAEMFCLEFDKEGRATGTELPYWADQICSFSRGHITKLVPNARVGHSANSLHTEHKMLTDRQKWPVIPVGWL